MENRQRLVDISSLLSILYPLITLYLYSIYHLSFSYPIFILMSVIHPLGFLSIFSMDNLSSSSPCVYFQLLYFTCLSSILQTQCIQLPFIFPLSSRYTMYLSSFCHIASNNPCLSYIYLQSIVQKSCVSFQFVHLLAVWFLSSIQLSPMMLIFCILHLPIYPLAYPVSIFLLCIIYPLDYPVSTIHLLHHL